MSAILMIHIIKINTVLGQNILSDFKLFVYLMKCSMDCSWYRSEETADLDSPFQHILPSILHSNKASNFQSLISYYSETATLIVTLS